MEAVHEPRQSCGPTARQSGNRAEPQPPNFHYLISIFGTQNGKLADIAYLIFFVRPN